MSKIKVVSFDADGTLVTPDFSQAVWYEGVPHLYARKNGLSFHKAKEFIEKEYQVVGDCRVEWYDIKYWLQRFGLGDCHQQLLEDYRHTVSWYPDVKQALSSLRKNYTLIVVSCSTREFLPYLLDGIERYFARVFSSVSDYGQIKSPEFFLEVCRQMGISPIEMAHVGDLWEQDFVVPSEAGIKAFHLDRRGERKGESSLRSLADLELRLRGLWRNATDGRE
jgi:putative hydrolase of the HAD superfamily